MSKQCVHPDCATRVHDHGDWCELHDRELRNRGRFLNGFPPFTETEYRNLRVKLYGRPCRMVLVVSP